MSSTHALLARLAIVSLLLALPQAALAGSTDLTLFGAAPDNAPPNILILIDTSGSMKSPPKGCDSCDSDYDKWMMAKDAVLAMVPQVNPPDGMGGYVENARFGVFFFDGNEHGARPVLPIRDDNTATVLARMQAMNLDDVPGGTPLGAALTDVGRYFMGPDLEWNGLPAYGQLDLSEYDEPEFSGPSPIDAECRDSFVVFMTDGRSDDEDMAKYDNDVWCAAIGDADGDNVESDCSDKSDDWGDDVAYSMDRSDFVPAIDGTQNLIVHTIAFDLDDSHGLQDAADNGGGNMYTAVDYDSLLGAFTEATAAVFDGLVSFGAPTVSSTRTSDGGSFFHSYFRPVSKEPFWSGHLMALGLDAGGQITDSAGDPVFPSGNSGYIDPNTPSFWDAGDLLAVNAARTLYTTKTGARTVFSAANVTDLDLDLAAGEIPLYPNYNTPAVDLNTTTELRDALVNYVHGRDAFDDDGDSNITELRDAVLGDIFHSSPVIVGPPPTFLEQEEGFGPAGTSNTFLYNYKLRDRVLYAGANDGMLHAFEAGSAGDNPVTAGIEIDYYGPGTGAERFGYVPGLLLPALKMMPRNVPRTQYYVDGPIAVADAWLGAAHDYTFPKNSLEWTTVMVAGFREGGVGYLALDVTDPGAGATDNHGPYPKFLWEFTDERMGESWSEPVITRVKVRGGNGLGDQCGRNDGDGDCREQWVAIFGAGYRADTNPNDPAFVLDPSNSPWRHKSQAVFIVSLDDGSVLASIAYNQNVGDFDFMRYGFPSAPAVLDLNFDGFADVVYIGDMGGQLWKWDIHTVGEDSDADPEVDNWDAGIFFRAYEEATWTGGPGHFHSIFNPPAASFVKGKLVLAFGTGEREDLRDGGDASTTDENNRFYVVRDNFPIGGAAFGAKVYEDHLTEVTDPAVTPSLAHSGYYMIAEDGEKFLTDHQIFAGHVITTSYSPADGTISTDPCAPQGGGEAFLYVFNLESGTGFFADASAATGKVRRISVGAGLPSAPQLSTSIDKSSPDKLYIRTSSGLVTEVDAPPRNDPPAWLIYWRTAL
jgi:type IV pilus assembly protein PilY1